MIIKREWIKRKPLFKSSTLYEEYFYRGYFLLGIIPLYVSRSRAL